VLDVSTRLSLIWGWGPIGDPKPEWGWVWDEFCTHDGYEYEYGDGSNMMGMGLVCYNPVGNSPLTSLAGCDSSFLFHRVNL
jgi:hypothetical protein